MDLSLNRAIALGQIECREDCLLISLEPSGEGSQG